MPTNNTQVAEGPSLTLPNCIPLNRDSFVLSVETMMQLETEESHSKNEPSYPNAFIQGLSYTASWGAGSDLSPKQLESVAVGIQEHAVAPGTQRIVASTEEIINSDLFDASPLATEALATAKRIQKQSAKAVAFDAAAKRVSRRLLLAERSKKLTITCPTTGIVSLIEIPAIPFPQNNPQLAKAMVWSSPFADLANCRGIAQQGIDYLRRLDTQVLAGVLIVLADTYELFRFQPFDTGAQKNAILRTAGKFALIDAIIMIETLIHSANCSYLPKLSLALDQNLSEYGLEVRMQAYLKLLADAIAKPDKDVWDEKKVKPQYPIRPVYIKDVKNAEKKISFLARQEQINAKKEFAEDKKAGKIAISLFSKQISITSKLKLLLDGIMSDEGMLVMPPMIIDAVCMKLATFEGNANAEQLIKIIRKDRKALILKLEELEDSIGDSLEVEEELEAEEDDFTPGNEEAVDEIDEIEEEAEGTPEEGSTYRIIDESAELSQEAKDVLLQPIEEKSELIAPEGLNAWEQLLWKKKMLKAATEASGASIERKIVQNDIPSVATYVPSTAKDKLGRD